jgi:hypothetical protein
MVILNSPANPTSGVLNRSDLEQITQLAISHDLFVLSDEIYSQILYEGEFHSIASLPGLLERTIILDGFSKTYAMTGWRLGYGVMPVDVAQAVSRLITNSVSCTGTATQIAGVRAPQDDVDVMVAEFKKRRDLIVNGLNLIPGFHVSCPRERSTSSPTRLRLEWNPKIWPITCGRMPVSQRRLAPFLVITAKTSCACRTPTRSRTTTRRSIASTGPCARSTGNRLTVEVRGVFDSRLSGGYNVVRKSQTREG